MINGLNNSGKKNIPIPSQIQTLNIIELNTTIIGADAYRAACKLKKVQIFTIFIKDLEYQTEKEARSEIIQEVLYSNYTTISSIYFIR